jgi:hypothetical protein
MNAMGAVSRNERRMAYGFYRKLCILALGGGAAFWVASIATSLLPLAAEYRASYSNWSMQTVWFGSLPAGLIFGCCVGFSLLRFFMRIPAKSPVLKSLILSAAAWAIALLLIDVPMISHGSGDALRYFFIGAAFDAARSLVLGVVIGFIYKRLHGSA